jgi:hypothetical protein
MNKDSMRASSWARSSRVWYGCRSDALTLTPPTAIFNSIDNRQFSIVLYQGTWFRPAVVWHWQHEESECLVVLMI